MSLSKSPRHEWKPFLSKKPLTDRDYAAVAHALGLSLTDVSLMQFGHTEPIGTGTKASAA